MPWILIMGTVNGQSGRITHLLTLTVNRNVYLPPKRDAFQRPPLGIAP